jgi:hypothetical protein
MGDLPSRHGDDDSYPAAARHVAAVLAKGGMNMPPIHGVAPGTQQLTKVYAA